MADIVDPATRSRMMSGIRGKNTRPEVKIRKALHAKGFRYQLHRKDLPGKPDMVFPKYRAVVFIHGCFWHRHCCSLFRWPSSNVDFWQNKLSGNQQKDIVNNAGLEALGWKVLIVWECAIRGRYKVGAEDTVTRIADWLLTGIARSELAERTDIQPSKAKS